MKVKTIIASRGRPWAVDEGAGAMFPDAIWVLCESEAKDYNVPEKNKLIHSDDKPLQTQKLNLAMRTFKTGTLLLVDDDCIGCFCLVGRKSRKITRPSEIMNIITSTAIVSKEAGCKLFGFRPIANPISGSYSSYAANAFVNFKAPIFPPMGVHSRDIFFDENLASHDDLDFTMRHLLKHRIIWCDNRFHFLQKGVAQTKGGLMNVRTEEQETREKDILEKRWGRHLRMEKKKGVRMESASILVSRKQ